MRIAALAQLGQELVAPHDRPGQQVGEERQVQREVQRAGRLQLPAVDVDHVAQRHEREEGDGDGERHLQERHGSPQPQHVGEVVDVDRDEAVVLEPPQQAQSPAQDDAHGQPPAARSVVECDDGAPR